MASTAEIIQAPPDTLPEDFSEWDSGLSSPTLPHRSNRFQSAAEQDFAPAPPEEPVSRQVKVLAVMDGSTPAPLFSALGFYATHDDVERSRREKLRRIRRRILAVTAVAVFPILLLLVLIPLRNPNLRQRITAVKAAIANPPATPETDPTANRLKPSPATLLTKVSQPVASTLKIAPAAQPARPQIPALTAAAETDQETPQQVEPTMMSNQLAAPKRIPHDINVVPKPEAPPNSGIGVAGIDGLNGSGSATGPGLVSASKAPKVSIAIPAKITISSSVAAGMLLHRTVPQYPAIALSAHVAGTVELLATVSKQGTVENLRVISGPAMLRQAAVDAVSSWQYKPYLFNGVPVEMETSVNVVFTIP